MPLQNPYVIILILTYNGKELLKDSISSYLANDYGSFEVVVIDNGSSDGTQEYVLSNFPGVHFIRSETNLFYSGGFNLGLKYAFEENKADYVLITNNDVLADKHLITALVEAAMEDEKRGFVIGKVYYYDKPDTLQTVGKKYDDIMWNGGHIGQGEIDKGQYDRAEERAWCDDIYWLVSGKVYALTGGYDTEFEFQAEDFDWQVRAKQKGFVIYYTPQAKLWHKDSSTLGRISARKAYYDARNPLIVHMKYRTPEQFRKFFHIRLKAVLKATLNQLLRLKLNYVKANLLGLLSAATWGVNNHKLSVRHFI
jgi:GT2 family glycosyltransferase